MVQTLKEAKTCVLSGAQVHSLGSIEEAKANRAEGVCTNVGIVCTDMLNTYHRAVFDIVTTRHPLTEVGRVRKATMEKLELRK
jgi:hypothetical protein